MVGNFVVLVSWCSAIRKISGFSERIVSARGVLPGPWIFERTLPPGWK